MRSWSTATFTCPDLPGEPQSVYLLVPIYRRQITRRRLPTSSLSRISQGMQNRRSFMPKAGLHVGADRPGRRLARYGDTWRWLVSTCWRTCITNSADTAVALGYDFGISERSPSVVAGMDQAILSGLVAQGDCPTSAERQSARLQGNDD